MENIENSVMDIAIAPLRYKIEKKLQAAELVSKDDRNFDRVLPLEQQPALAQLREYNEDLVNCVEVSVLAFVKIGYLLNQIRLSNTYRYVQDVGLKGYTSFYKFCEDVYRLPKKTVQRFIDVNVRYCGNGPDFIVKGAERYSFRQLAELSSFKNGLDGKVPPTASVREIEKLRKYYASRDWEVSTRTTWKDDLETYIQEQAEVSKFTRDRVKKFAFESGPETRVKKEGVVNSGVSSKPESSPAQQPKNAYKEYDVLLEFLDQSLKKLETLRGKCPSLSKQWDDVYTVLQVQAQELRAKKSRDQFTGFD